MMELLKGFELMLYFEGNDHGIEMCYVSYSLVCFPLSLYWLVWTKNRSSNHNVKISLELLVKYFPTNLNTFGFLDNVESP